MENSELIDSIIPKNPNIKIIDFDIIIPKDTKVLCYRITGNIMRRALSLNDHDKDKSAILIISIPDRILSVNTSFFLGCFEESVVNLGEEKFRNKYIFKCDEILMKSIEDGIHRATKIIAYKKE